MKFTMIRRIAALGLILVLAAGIPIQASSASTEKVTEDAASTKSLQEAQDEKAQLEKALKEAQSTIEDLRDSKGDIESKVTELNQQLIDISARITDLENQLTAKSEDIQETKDELAGAKEREAQQYADMKVRIQFMYENGQTSYLEALLSSRNISEFLNSADYIAQIQSYDRQKLTEYQDTVESIVNLEAQLEQEYTDLEALKSTVESNKATVAAMMRQKESELADISGDIEDAQSDADYYAAEIQAQEELIAAINFAHRYAQEASRLAREERDPTRQRELEQIASNCTRVPEYGATTFWEACQTFWFIQSMLQIESSGHSISPGRFDQYMYPYLAADTAISSEFAQELVDCCWIKLNDINKTRDEVSAQAFAGYAVFQNLCVGGQTEDGRDATNPLTYMCMEATAHVRLPQPSFSIRVWQGTPDEFL